MQSAGEGTRTRDLLITNQLLYQLSYASKNRTKKIKEQKPACKNRALLRLSPIIKSQPFKGFF
jgi:hypothetical protein